MFRGLFCGCCDQQLTQHEEGLKDVPPAPLVGFTDEFVKKGGDSTAANVPHGVAGQGVNYLDATNKSQRGSLAGDPAVGALEDSDNAAALKAQGGMSARSQRSASSRASSLTPEEKEREKARLQKLVKEFAKEAVGGFDVTLVSAITHEIMPRTLSMDRYLSKIRIKEAPDTENPLEYPMRDIGTIYKGLDVQKKCRNLPDDLAANCVGFEIQDNSSPSAGTQKAAEQKPPVILLSFKDSYQRDKFYTCIKILRMSVELNQAPSGGGGVEKR